MLPIFSWAVQRSISPSLSHSHTHTHTHTCTRSIHIQSHTVLQFRFGIVKLILDSHLSESLITSSYAAGQHYRFQLSTERALHHSNGWVKDTHVYVAKQLISSLKSVLYSSNVARQKRDHVHHVLIWEHLYGYYKIKSTNLLLILCTFTIAHACHLHVELILCC